MSKVKALMALFKPLLANDADPEAIKKVEDDAEKLIKDDEADPKDPKTAKDEMTEEEEKIKAAKDEEDAKEKAEKDKIAKDEADQVEKEKMANDSKLAMDSAIKGVEQRFAALRQAERDVRPVVGELACDSADEVYRTALKQMGCADHATLPSAALQSVFKAYSRPAMANDSNPILPSSRENVKNFFEGK